jgi:galactokinase
MIHPSALRSDFPRGFGEPRAFFAPGRVNLIGEHTDYNDGFVLPLALELGITVIGAPRRDSRLHVTSIHGGRRAEIKLDLQSPGPSKTGRWSDYVEGIAQMLRETNPNLRGAELVLASDLPTGAGLSSSAALEIAVGFALLSLSNLPVNLEVLALAGQSAEHRWVGTRCGIMDQLASACAREKSALFIDCRSLEMLHVPVIDATSSLLVADTRVKHSLASSAYNQRREECEAAVKRLQEVLPHVRALRDVSSSDLEQHGHLLSELLFRRARHVVSENERVEKTVALLKNNQLEAVGDLLVASHRSLQHDYEVSCPELDVLVDTAIRQPGVLGARMTGGGFGGSIVCLTRTAALDSVQKALVSALQREFGQVPRFWVTKGGQGVGELF